MKPRVIILYNKVWDYRVEIFNLINEKYDLTVAYADKKYLGKKYEFKTLYTPWKRVGPFQISRKTLRRIVKDYDVVIGLYDVRLLSIMLLSLFRKGHYQYILWGIGVTASYNNRFDSKQRWDRIRYFFGRRADALVFYSDYPLKRYLANGFEKEKLFVAHNTVAVENTNGSVAEERKDFLFIGTLYKQKGVEELIDSYISCIGQIEDAPVLHIIGGGPYLEELGQLVADTKLEENIKLHGPIYDRKIISNMFRKAIVCISPNQAGLSVLTSMGHGVPYLTRSDSLTGGERLNIENKVNGIIYEPGDNELTKQMIWISQNREKMLEMGRNAYQHYTTKRRPDQMAGSIIQAIEFSMSQSYIGEAS